MDHIAILDKKFKYLDKILDGTKQIESRWYVHKIAPWDKVNDGDTVYFKNSGENVKAKASVSQVLQFELNPETVLEISNKYSKLIGFDDSYEQLLSWCQKNRKRYCILVFLKDAKSISEFKIDKTGFGSACAWMIVKDINKVKF